MKLEQKDLTYNDYLKVPELLALQQPTSNPPHHDEMLFIVIHQAYELWFKIILIEVENAITHMHKQHMLRVHHFTKRVNEILKLLIQQIHILETMAPAEFLVFRGNLNPASGFQSLQFRELEFLLGLQDPHYFEYYKNRPEMVEALHKRVTQKNLKAAYLDLLAECGAPIATSDNEEAILRFLIELYQSPEQHPQLYLLSETLVDIDLNLALWREHHLRVVERIIGFKRGTGGSSGVAYLRQTTVKKCFPFLWDVRTHLKGADHAW